MKACREARRIFNALRSRKAKRDRAAGRRPNGGWGWVDDPGLEGLLQTSKRRYCRNRLPNIGY